MTRPLPAGLKFRENTELEFFGIGFAQILRRIVSIRVKALRDTNLVASRHVKREKVSLLVDVRGSKTVLRTVLV